MSTYVSICKRILLNLHLYLCVGESVYSVCSLSITKGGLGVQHIWLITHSASPSPDCIDVIIHTSSLLCDRSGSHRISGALSLHITSQLKELYSRASLKNYTYNTGEIAGGMARLMARRRAGMDASLKLRSDSALSKDSDRWTRFSWVEPLTVIVLGR